MGTFSGTHTEKECPIRRGSYCPLCCSNGHSPGECRDTAILGFRKPQFVEQLIPASVLELYQIRSRTPIADSDPVTPGPEDVLEVPETEEALRATLTFYGVKPMICQEKGKTDKKEIKENKKRLQAVADSLGRKLIFVGAPHDLIRAVDGLGSLFDGPGVGAKKIGAAAASKKISASGKENGVGSSSAAAKKDKAATEASSTEKKIKKIVKIEKVVT